MVADPDVVRTVDVMIAVPGEIAVTSPVLETVATPALLVDHLYFAFGRARPEES
jgi:hypothetical protein